MAVEPAFTVRSVCSAMSMHPLTIFAAVGALTAACGVPLCAGGGEPGRADRPNIILAMADDLGWGDPSYNGGWIETPHLDDMARSGLRFDRFYSASAVCSPTRGSCLTGRNPQRLGIPHANRGRLEGAESSLAEVLGARGYVCGHFGKWHLGTLTTTGEDSNRGTPGDARFYSPPWLNGFDVSFSTEAKVPTFHPMRVTRNRAPEPVDFDDPNYYGTSYWEPPIAETAPEGRRVPVDENLSGDDSRVLMDRALEFIGDAVARDTPFFAVVWFHSPHKPLTDPEQVSAVDSADAYTDAVQDLDAQMGRLREALRDLGVRDRTLLWFTSDNGPENGVGRTGGLRARKRSLHEGGVRVPTILEWPQAIPVARTTVSPAVTSDFYPTVLDLFDVAVEDQRPLDGISLLPLIRGTVARRHRPIGFVFQSQASWVTEQYKLITKDDGATYELYDLLADPFETRDIAAATGTVASELRAQLETWQAAVSRDSAYVHRCRMAGVPDCNGNGVPDLCDLLDATSDDADADGVPDDCDERFRRGDCNGDGGLDIADAICTLGWLFLGAAAPGCVAATDVDGTESVEVSDAIAVLSFLFRGGLPPVEPFPGCEPAHGELELGCELPGGCRED